MAKERICITIEKSILVKARGHKMNISNICEAALLRELEIYTKNAYTKALEKQKELLLHFIHTNNLREEFDKFKYELVS